MHNREEAGDKTTAEIQTENSVDSPSNCTSTGSPDWSSLLSSSRAARNSSPPLSYVEIQTTHTVHFPEILRLLCGYIESLDEHQIMSAQQSRNSESSVSVPTKNEILDIRRALRFGVSCLLFGGGAEEEGAALDPIRSTIQEEAVMTCHLHKGLAGVLSREGNDSKSRVLAARLLSNLITSNAITAQTVMNDVALSPTESARTTKLLKAMTLTDVGADDEKGNVGAINWVDMISASARTGDRDAVAAVVAALHNILAALQNKEGVGKEEQSQNIGLPPVDEKSVDSCTASEGSYKSMAASIAADTALMCNLVRHILPVCALKPSDLSQDETNKADEATEWISLTLEKLSSLGLFPEMYRSVGVGSVDKSLTDHTEIVTPEQVVILHCLGRAVEEWLSASTSGEGCVSENPLGGTGGQQAVISTHRFLAEQGRLLRQSLDYFSELTTVKEAYEGEGDCRLSAYLSILETMASFLGGDDGKDAMNLTSSRNLLGRETSFLTNVITDLGQLVDRLLVANRDVKARDHLDVTKEDERDLKMTKLFVRLVGNLCYNCVYNQDLLRTTRVPYAGGSQMDGQPVRTGLHVLLSCTSFSFRCFTLREWALVAIRNALDENQQNQDEVRRLEAHKAVDTPELKNMGIKTVLDENGQVRVEPRS